ncbi:uncharacterized protein LOC108632362 isoform X2 [Ceratina calcarata]|uniref:Uncharacterized protein LOC108632362 isoform X2 n=1 Tax=Ceratina calcarata TaxID=156304 RepID=A0AAJ7NFB9_9HYME|nr:uncharacterized protein LOC108632362 isoform X2 [Ceratina calcarata]
MSKGYAEGVLFITIQHLCLSILQCSTTCDYVCDFNGCKRSIKNLNISIEEYCTNNTSTDVSFSLIERGSNMSEFPAIVGLGIKPPKTKCKYDMTLYAKEMLNKKECTNYKFNSYRNEIHSKFSICFISDEKQYKNETQVLIPYIFTACYKVQFYFNNSYEWMEGNNKFLETNYKKTELTEPRADCVYYVINHENNTVLRFRVNLTLPVVTEAEIRLTRNISEKYETFNNFTSKFDVLNKYLGTEYYDTYNKTLITRYVKDFDSYKTSNYEKWPYRFKIILRRDIRCWETRVWKQPNSDCIYYTKCRHNEEQISLNHDNQWNSMKYIVAIILSIIGIIYFLYISWFCIKRGKAFYENDWVARTIAESAALTENVVNRNIVLVYPKGSKKFMNTMSDFRTMLCEACHCIIRDWHNGAEWNHVARIGPSEWFSEMLRDKCRVIWIDVPATRLLIGKKYESRNVEIGDFRDAVFPMIFNLSKWDVERSTPCEIKHFIVRLEEFDNLVADDDPFIDLHASVRYSMPQDLDLLCSNLSVLESVDKRRGSS